MKHTIAILALLLMCSSLSAQTGSNRQGSDDDFSHGNTRNQNGGNESFRGGNGDQADVYHGQSGGKKTYSGQIYTEVTEAPEYPGGTSEMEDYLDSNTEYPESADDANLEGTIYVQFVVETDGVITNATVQGKGLNKDCNAEAIRVVTAMPKWMPAQLNGKPVRCYQKVGIRFYP